MAMGRRKKQRQAEFWVATADVPQGPGRPFYAKLNELLAVFNPLDRPVSRTIRVDLYYTGLTDNARIRRGEGKPVEFALDRRFAVELCVEVGPRGMEWYVIE